MLIFVGVNLRSFNVHTLKTRCPPTTSIVGVVIPGHINSAIPNPGSAANVPAGFECKFKYKKLTNKK